MAKFWVEMDDFSTRDYGRIHKPGCRNCKDGMPLDGEASDIGGLLEIFNNTLGWDYDFPNELDLAPCAKELLNL